MPLFGEDIFSALNRSVAILGPGLIGGSLAMALRSGDNPWRVTVWTRHAETISRVAQALPHCVVTDDLQKAIAGTDVAVLCTPPHAIESLGEKLAKVLPDSTVVTDAGSVKRQIVTTLEFLFGGRFIGAHPIAGSEQSGIHAARADLFKGALCLLTPTPKSLPNALQKVHDLWTDAGCVLKTISPSEHDRIMGRVSHLPHAVAAALVQAVCESATDITAFAGAGFRDTTRVAGGPESMWAEILLDNRDEVMTGIADLQARLDNLKTSLAQGDRSTVEAFLARARKLRVKENGQI